MDLNKYLFSWTNFDSSRSKRYKYMREDHNFTDVTLVCNDDNEIKAHKLILSSFSPLLKKMFENNPHPQPLVFLRGVEKNDLNAILDFIYTGEASVEQENFNSFLETAIDLEIEELSSFSSESSNSEIRLGFTQNKVSNANKNKINNDTEKLLEVNVSEDQVEEEKFIINEEFESGNFIAVNEKVKSHFETNLVTKENCDFEYVNKVTCPSYFQKISADPSLFECDNCEYKSCTANLMEHHLNETRHTSVRFKCKFCEEKTLKLKTLFKHIENYHPVERFQCESCEFIGASYDSLAHHTRSIHLGMSYSCKECPYKTTALKSVEIHTERVHCKTPPIPCDRSSCNYQGNRLGLIDHIKRIHKPCKVCAYEPINVQDKDLHKRTHRIDKYKV